MSEETFAYGGYSFLIQKTETGQLKIYRKSKKGLKELQGQKAYQIARAYKLKIEKEPSLRKPRSFAKKAKRRPY